MNKILNNEEKLEFIENLLDSDNEFEHFILAMENSELECDIPSDLEIKLKNSLNIRKIYYFDIVKIAACTIFALLFWQFIIINPKVQANANIVKDKVECEQNIQLMQQINHYLYKVKNMKGDK